MSQGKEDMRIYVRGQLSLLVLLGGGVGHGLRLGEEGGKYRVNIYIYRKEGEVYMAGEVDCAVTLII